MKHGKRRRRILLSINHKHSILCLWINKLVHLNRKKIGKREKMFDLRKRMSEKLEEKRRHFVEKMRGP
ncbi:hypothetical protein S83_052860 [Arachis hypogaea]